MCKGRDHLQVEGPPIFEGILAILDRIFTACTRKFIANDGS